MASKAADRIRVSMGHEALYSRRQEEILDALEALFMERGFREVTVEDLVSAARCSRGTFYELASSKEQVVLLVLDRMWRRLGTSTRQGALEASDAVSQLELFFGTAATIFRPFAARQFYDDVAAYGPARRLFEEHLAITTEFVADLLAGGIAAGQFRPVDPRLAATTLIAATDEIAFDDYWSDEGGIEDAILEVVRMVLWGVIDQGAAPPPALLHAPELDGHARVPGWAPRRSARR